MDLVEILHPVPLTRKRASTNARPSVCTGHCSGHFYGFAFGATMSTAGLSGAPLFAMYRGKRFWHTFKAK